MFLTLRLRRSKRHVCTLLPALPACCRSILLIPLLIPLLIHPTDATSRLTVPTTPTSHLVSPSNAAVYILDGFCRRQHQEIHFPTSPFTLSGADGHLIKSGIRSGIMRRNTNPANVELWEPPRLSRGISCCIRRYATGWPFAMGCNPTGPSFPVIVYDRLLGKNRGFAGAACRNTGIVTREGLSPTGC